MYKNCELSLKVDGTNHSTFLVMYVTIHGLLNNTLILGSNLCVTELENE